MLAKDTLEQEVRDIISTSGTIEGFNPKDNKFLVKVLTNSGFHTASIIPARGINPGDFSEGTPVQADIGTKKIGKSDYGVLIRAYNLNKKIIADNYPGLEYSPSFFTSNPSAME